MRFVLLYNQKFDSMIESAVFDDAVNYWRNNIDKYESHLATIYCVESELSAIKQFAQSEDKITQILGFAKAHNLREWAKLIIKTDEKAGQQIMNDLRSVGAP